MLSSSWWCSSWSVSVGTFFLDFFCGGMVSCFSAETTVGANVGGFENRLESLNTRITKQNREQKRTSDDRWGDKESPKA
jgi:hypothetical protein